MLKFEGKMYYTTAEAGAVLGKSQEVVRAWCRNGWIEAFKIGRDYYIPEDEVERLKRYLANNPALRRNWKAWFKEA